MLSGTDFYRTFWGLSEAERQRRTYKIKAIDRTRHIEQYLLDVLNDGENVPKTEFEEFDTNVECGMYTDVYYQRFSFSVDERVYRIDGPNIESELESIADELRS